MVASSSLLGKPKPNAASSSSLTKALIALAVYPSKNISYSWNGRRTNDSNDPKYLAICPLCKREGKEDYSGPVVQGPFNGKISFRPRCIHSKSQIVEAAGLTLADLYDGDSDMDVLPGVMPQLPPPVHWDPRGERPARERQFFDQLPKTGDRKLFERVVQIYIDSGAGDKAWFLNDVVKSLSAVAKHWDVSIPDSEIYALAVNAVQQRHEGKRFEQAKDLAAKKGLVLQPFAAYANNRPEWLVQNVLVADLPIILGGPKKTLKTGLSLDLAISLGSGRPFLGVERFSVPKLWRVAVYSGENGGYVLFETALRIARSKGLEQIPEEVSLCDRLPQLSDAEDLKILQASLAECGAEIVIIDPMYLCLLEGTKVQAANMLEMGPQLRRLADACLAVDCQPVLIHHDNRQVKVGAVPQLDHLAFAGFGEFARQWLLTNRRRSYKDGTGHHELLLAHGGCFGRDGLLAVDIDEGQIRDDFTGRSWAVSVRTLEEARKKTAEERLARADQKAEETVARTAGKILVAIQDLEREPGESVGRTKVRDRARLNGETMRQGVAYLVAQKQIEELDSFLLPGSRKPGSALKRLRV
jgi:hypothetical protein